MYFLDPVERLGAPREAVVEKLGYKENYIPQGFEIPGDATQQQVLASHPTLMHFVKGLAADTGPEGPRVWWVCQGKTYEAERDLGLIWAPKQGTNGATREFWRALQDVKPGETILHYANGALRAVSTATEGAVEAPQPEELGEQWERDGWLVRCEYKELDPPISLAEIPEEWRIAAGPPFTSLGGVRQGYLFPLSSDFIALMASRFPQLGLDSGNGKPPASPPVGYSEPLFQTLLAEIRGAGLQLDDQTIRRYHVSLKTRGFVVLSGISGSGKTWLAELYAQAVGANSLLVPVAPNWTANEDLLGYYDPLAKEYRHTTFSRFLQRAASAWSEAQRAGVAAQPYHLILDEMNLARVEYYFAKFLSAMEIRAREGSARLELDGDTATELTPNLMFIGTVNVDETTHGFADKVYDRAQLIEIPVSEAAIRQHLVGTSYATPVLEVWKAMRPVAPFAHRILDEIAAYVRQAQKLGVDVNEALDEQLVQKVLPKIRGTDPRIGEALGRFIELADPAWPLSAAKAKAMQDMFASHGFTSYFET
jgi:MoxR-like ATPase